MSKDGLYNDHQMAVKSVPYLVDYLVDISFRLPTEFHCRDFQGLNSCILLSPSMSSKTKGTDRSGDRSARLLTSWQNKDHFESEDSAFCASISNKNPIQPIWQGYERTSKVREKPKWWKKSSVLWLWVVHIVAVLASVEALRNHYVAYFAASDLSIYNKKTQYDYLVASDFKVELQIRNNGDWVSRLKINKINLIDRTTNEVVRDETENNNGRLSYPNIQVGEIIPIPITVAALKKGSYLLSIEGNTKSGYFNCWDEFSADIEIKVWPLIECKLHNLILDENQCICIGTLYSGIDYVKGLELSAELKYAKDLRFKDVSNALPNTIRIRETSEEDKAIKIEWCTPQLKAMKQSTFFLFIKWEEMRTQEEWESIRDNIEFQFY